MSGGTQLPTILRALRFHEDSTSDLANIPGDAWPELLHQLDESQLTLALAARVANGLPAFVRVRLERNLTDNALRHERLLAAHGEIRDALDARGIEYIVLKGLSQWPHYTDDPRLRPQYDIDLYVPDEAIPAAAAVLSQLGYESAGVTDDPGTDHLPVMIRKTGWTWRHDYYDPEMPPSLELHFRFWNGRRMGFEVGDVEQFWQRRVVRTVGGIEFAALDPADSLTYSALHLLRHLLGGDLRLRHVYEIAHFLERSAADEAFWSRWNATGLESCRVAEGIAFRLARDWFHCGLHPAAREAIERLPAGVRRWFSLFGSTLVGTGQQAGKNELWLHLCLVNSRRAQLRIAARRLFPTGRSRVVRDAHLPAASMRVRVRRVWYEASFLAKRAVHHLRALAPTLRGAYWWCAGKH